MSTVTSRHLVITGAKSRSHLVHIASYVRSVLADAALDAVRLSFVEADAFLSAPAVTAADLRAMLPEDPRLTIEAGLPGWRFAPESRAEYVSVGAPGLTTLVALVRANPRHRFAVVVTDEGIGTYGSARTRAAAMERQGVSTPVALVKSSLIQVVTRVVTTTRWAAYRADGTTWSVPRPILEEFRRYVPDAHPGSSREVVILTQPFVDLGVITEAEHLAYVDAMADAARAHGLEPVIRPHPAEDTAKYGKRRLMTARGTAELDPQVVGAAIVMGGPSTALVNVSAMFAARTVWVSIPGLEHLDSAVSARQAGIFEAFLGRPVPVGEAESAVGRALSS